MLRERASDFVVPAAVLAEGVLTGHTGHDYQVRRLLGIANVVDVDEQIGLAAGVLRQGSAQAGLKPVPSGVDAIVVSEADAQAARDDVHIITSDRSDFEMLASLALHAERLSVIVV